MTHQQDHQQAPIVIVGTGLAGYSLVRELRKLSADLPILMITADDGHSYSKPMLSTGFTKGKQADELIQTDAEAMAAQLGVELRTYATVTGLDPQQHLLYLGDTPIKYRKLVLAWGADVIRLSLAGDGVDGVYSINDLLDYRAFRKALAGKQRVAIMGAGLIGCEFANDLHNGGYQVDVIAPSSTAMPGLAPEAVGGAVTQALRDAGVRFHLGTCVQRIDRQAAAYRLTLENGSILDTDLVISAVGLRPRIQLAKAAGLATGRGILVNRALATSDADIYALGDCAEVDGHLLMYVLPLMAAAKALAKTLAGEGTQVAYPAMPVMVKTPLCPTVICPPPHGAAGRWHYEGEGCNIKALFEDDQGQLLGFALTGSCVAEKQQLTKSVPPLHC